MPIRRVTTEDVLPSALHIALANDVSVYDACYVALAAKLSIPVITADERLAAKVKVGRAKVVTLKQWESSSR